MNKKNESNITTKILNELGLDKLPEDKRDDVLAKIGELLLKKIFVETIDKLDNKNAEEFRFMLESEASAEDIESFLNTKIDNYNAVVEKIVEDLKKELREAI